MSICYLILTCEKYLSSRVHYQLDTYLRHVPREDIYLISSKPDISNRIYGWNTPDDYNSLPLKNIEFFRNMDIDYDWYMLLDDDTFVFVDRLQKLLSIYDPSKNIWIGKILDHVQSQFCAYMSGGAGSLISRPLYRLICSYVRTNDMKKIHCHWCADLCVGMWILDLCKNNTIDIINNNNFHTGKHFDEKDLNNAITFHNVREISDTQFYYQIMIHQDTSIVLITDEKYFRKAHQTIKDLRTRGNWHGNIVLITIDFILPSDFKFKYNVINISFPSIDKNNLQQQIGSVGFKNSDKREINKLNQWEKIHVFDKYFKQWKRIIFLDAGLRVLDDIKYLLDLDYRNSILAPNDSGDGPNKKDQYFECQLDKENISAFNHLTEEFGSEILKSYYFLNCIWIYDTNILNLVTKEELIEYMNKYPISRTNEMAIMNLIFTFKYKLWKPFPEKIPTGKYLFNWSELNIPGSTWNDFCYIKYPVTISFDI